MKTSILGLVALVGIAITRVAPAKEIPVTPPPLVDVLSGTGWTYQVSFHVKNKAKITSLIQCESTGRNVSHPDSDGIISDGILQYHRSKKTPGIIGSGTWAWMSKLSGIKGSPLNPSDAIRMTDWAISNGFGSQWTCWGLRKL